MSKSAPFTPGDANDIFLNQLGKGRRTREVFMWKRGVYKQLVDAYGLPRSLLNAFTEHAKKYSPGRADVCYRGLTRLFGLDGNHAELWR